MKKIVIEFDPDILKTSDECGVDLLGYLLRQLRRQIEAECKKP